MSDSFFAFDTDLPPGCLTPPCEDCDDGDRFNDETFGDAAGEWQEENHQLGSALLEREKYGPGVAGLLAADFNGHGGLSRDLASDISRLMVDDEEDALLAFDDPCVMSAVRRNGSGSVAAGRGLPTPIARPRSPPVASILESDLCGSPSTGSIWSANAPASLHQQLHQPQQLSSSSRHQQLQPQQLQPARLHSLASPFPPAPGTLPLPAGKVRTVEELEQDLLSSSPRFPRPPPGMPGMPDLSRPPPPLLLAAVPPPPGTPRGRIGGIHPLPLGVRHILPPQLMHRGGGSGPGIQKRPGAGAAPWNRSPGGIDGVGGHGSDWRPADPYSCLMTNKECLWLLTIQRLQVQNNADYYFKHFMARKLRSARRDSRDRRDDKPLELRDYKPPSMENSLGKLQVASVTAPRRIIDLQVINHESADGTRDHKESKRHRQTLLTMEQLYQHVMTIEELDQLLCIGGGQDSAPVIGPSVGSQPPAAADSSAVEDPDTRRLHAVHQLEAAVGRDTLLVQMLSIRKGKTLLLRAAPFLHTRHVAHIALVLLKNLPLLLNRDKTNLTLHRFHVIMQMVISSSGLAEILELTRALTSSTDLTSDVTSSPLQVIAASPFGITVLMLLIFRGDQLTASPTVSSAAAAEWRHLYDRLLLALSSIEATLAPPIEPFPPAQLAKHVSRPELAARLATL